MILVTGSTGTVGREVVRELRGLQADFRALVHDPAKAVQLKGQGVDSVIGDFQKLDSIRGALQGMKCLFLLTPASPDLANLEGSLVEEAKRAGVRQVVKLSALGADDPRAGSLATWHAAAEKRVQSSGLSYTLLRPAYFSQNLLGSADSIRKQRTFYLPADGARIAPIDARDIGAVAARVLTERGHEGKIHELTGPEALSFDQMAERISAAAGKPVKFVAVTDEVARKHLLSSGMPEWLVAALSELFAYFRAGGGSRGTDTVERVTGKPARRLDDFLRENAAAFKG